VTVVIQPVNLRADPSIDHSWANMGPQLTLLVKSKMHGKAVLHRTFQGKKDRIEAAGDPHSRGVGDESIVT
jgi:hypothetical protein